MSTYLAATFIAPYSPTDIVLKFVNAGGQRTFGINVCQYEKSSAEENELWIYLEDAKRRILDFATNQEAQLALTAFRNAVEALRPNCESAPIVAPPQTINTITLAAYKAQQSANSLIPLQWYDISDTAPVYDLGPVIRAQARTNNDFEPSGISLTTSELVTLNVLDDTISRREDVVNKNLAETRSFVYATASTYIKATNYSTVTAINSNYIDVTNNSIVEVTNCDQIKVINGSNVVLTDAFKVSFDNINIDLSSYGSAINNIQVNQTDSIGKLGREDMDGLIDNEVLRSYINLVEQNTPTLTGNLNKVLDNPIPDANGEFRILVGSGLGAYTLTIMDSAFTPLIVISAGMANTVVTFRWNKTTNLFELVQNAQSLNVVQLTVAFDGQTTIAGIAPVPTSPATSILEINGQVQEYGPALDYYITGNTLFWTNNSFELETDDVVILKYT